MKKYVLVVPLCLVCLFTSGACVAEIYKWVDENGRVHFGDAPAEDQKVEQVDLEINTFESVTYEDIEFAEPSANKKVTMYSTSWCGYCKKARKYFDANNIAYVEYDIETNQSARRAYDRLGVQNERVHREMQ